MEGFEGVGLLEERSAKVCNRCGCVYPLTTSTCPKCKSYTDEEAKEIKQKLLNERADENKNIGHLFFALAAILVIITVLVW